MRVGCAAIGVLGVLLRRRRRIAAVVDARLQREHVDHAPHSLRRRHQPVDAAKPLGQLLLERFDPRRVGSASLHLASVPAAALDGFGRSPGVAFLVVPIVGDRLELRLLVHLIARGQPKRMLCGPFTASAFEDGPAAFAQLRPLVRRTTPLGVLLVERLRHWLEGSACRRHGIVGAVLAIERLGKPRSALAHICFVHHALLLLQLRLCLSVLDVRTLPPPLTHWVLHLGRARRIPQRHVCAQRLAERSLVRGLVRLQRHRDRHLHCRRHRRLHTPDDLDHARPAAVLDRHTELGELQQLGAALAIERDRLPLPELVRLGVLIDANDLAVEEIVPGALQQDAALLARSQHARKLTTHLVDQPLGRGCTARTRALARGDQVEVEQRRAARLRLEHAHRHRAQRVWPLVVEHEREAGLVQILEQLPRRDYRRVEPALIPVERGDGRIQVRARDERGAPAERRQAQLPLRTLAAVAGGHGLGRHGQRRAQQHVGLGSGLVRLEQCAPRLVGRCALAHRAHEWELVPPLGELIAEHRHHGGTLRLGEGERTHATLRAGVGREVFGEGLVSRVHGVLERAHGHLRAAPQQRPHRHLALCIHSTIERRAAVTIDGVDAGGTARRQPRHGCGLPRLRRRHERRLHVLGGGVELRARLNERVHRVEVPARRGEHQRCAARGFPVHHRARCDQWRDYGRVPTLSGVHER
mmetsp:Transcript_41401/g.109866  ORF Transcript_41401/g.109866 Transcript_41401/m.109866 type:complete len:699 (-) Transcript_41401:1638-3734(-)